MPPLAPSLDALLQQLAVRRGQAPAISWRAASAADTAPPTAWRTLSYARLAQRAQALAHQLQHRHGLRAGDRVAWLGFNHPAQIALLFALARLGALLVPLNHRLSPTEWADALQDCSPALLVRDAHFAPAAHGLRQRLPTAMATATLTDFDPVEPALQGAVPACAGRVRLRNGRAAGTAVPACRAPHWARCRKPRS